MPLPTEAHAMRRGFTLVEVLVAIFIIAILIALLLPAVQAARGAARRVQCVNHLRQISLAVHGYAAASRDFLPAYHFRSQLSWRFGVLPYLEEQAVHDLAGKKYLAPGEAELLMRTPVKLYQCPETDDYVRTTPRYQAGEVGCPSDYFAVAAVVGSAPWLNGMFYGEAAPTFDDAIETRPGHLDALFKPAKLAYTTDGLSKTIAIYESTNRGKVNYWESAPTDMFAPLAAAPWVAAYGDGEVFLPPALTPFPWRAINFTNQSAIFSLHRGGANVAFGDGSVHFLGEACGPSVVRSLATREEGEAIRDQDWR